MVPGVVVPMPTLPFESMRKAEVVERPLVVVATAKSGRLEATEPVEVAWMERRANGEVVERPRRPAIYETAVVLVAVSDPNCP